MTNTAFDCRMCGHCCEGKGGIVVSPSDLQRLCDFLRMPADAVIAAYGEQAGDKLKIRCGEDGYCIFFRQGKLVHQLIPAALPTLIFQPVSDQQNLRTSGTSLRICEADVLRHPHSLP